MRMRAIELGILKNLSQPFQDVGVVVVVVFFHFISVRLYDLT